MDDIKRLGKQYGTILLKPEAAFLAFAADAFLENKGFKWLKEYRVRLSTETLAEIYKFVQDPTWDKTEYLEHMASGDVVVMFFRYKDSVPDAQKILKSYIGDKNPEVEGDTLRHSFLIPLRVGLYSFFVKKGKYWLNGVHCADDCWAAGRELRILQPIIKEKFGDDISKFLVE